MKNLNETLDSMVVRKGHAVMARQIERVSMWKEYQVDPVTRKGIPGTVVFCVRLLDADHGARFDGRAGTRRLRTRGARTTSGPTRCVRTSCLTSWSHD